MNKKLNKEKSSFEKNYDNINLLSYEGIAKGGFKTSTGRYDQTTPMTHHVATVD